MRVTVALFLAGCAHLTVPERECSAWCDRVMAPRLPIARVDHGVCWCHIDLLPFEDPTRTATTDATCNAWSSP
jgi:hypothetical protein